MATACTILPTDNFSKMLAYCEKLNQMADDQRTEIQRLKRQLAEINASSNLYERLIQQRDELGEWIVDRCTNAVGEVNRFLFDVNLSDEDFLPISWVEERNGKRYQIGLNTAYSIEEIDADD